MYVVIEYNQASRWPALYSDALYDSEVEAIEALEYAKTGNRANGRNESYAVGMVNIMDEG